MPQVSQKRNNKTTFIILKNTGPCLEYAIWLAEIMMQYASYKVHTSLPGQES